MKLKDAGFFIEKFEYCPEGLFKFSLTPGKVLDNGNQLVSMNMSLDRDVGTNTKVPFTIELERGENKWRTLIKTTHQRGACDFYTTYGGPLWFDVQVKLGLVAKSCPIPKVKQIKKSHYKKKQNLIDQVPNLFSGQL